MKLTSLTLTLVFFALSAFAQPDHSNSRAGNLARELVNQMELSEKEYIRIKEILEVKLEESNGLSLKYSDDALLYQDALAQLQQECDKAILAVLPNKAKTKYVSIQHYISTSQFISSKK